MNKKIIIGVAVTFISVFLVFVIIIRDNKLQKQIDEITRSMEANGFSENLEEESIGTSGELPSTSKSCDNNSEEDYAKESLALSEREKALIEATKYMEDKNISRIELIKELKRKGFSEEDSAFAADNCEIDWNEQALKIAIRFMGNGIPHSYKEVTQVLEGQGFTNEQVVYAADNCGADWNEQANMEAKNCMEFCKTRDSLIEMLISSGYTEEQAEYAADANGY